MNTGPYFSSLDGRDYHVFPDGRVLLSGVHILSDTIRGFTGAHRLVWFSNTGYLDTTRVHRKGNGAINRFVALESGKFVASGTSSQFAGRPVDHIFRFEADGSVDTTYRTFISWGEARDLVPLVNGSVYAGGRFLHATAPQDTIYVARFLADGTMDPSFNRPQMGLGALPDPGWGFGPDVYGLDTLPDGNLVVTGYFQFVNGQERRGICLLDPNGNLMDAFGGCGVFPYLYQPNPNLTISYGNLNGIEAYDATHYLVYGAYHGYGDGTTTDMQQRMVSRLFVGDITTGAAPLSWSPRAERGGGEGLGVRVYPNPNSGYVTLELEQVPNDAQLVVRDALGRVVQRQRVQDHYTTLELQHVGNGIYHIELYRAGERLVAQRLVVQH
ncbi:MAG: T9SS type A sorting domain-containing protein [Flavobacteriales bacterium]|nr:T9SS type A sorting domain-containing protein [Flavobacteriales bacterium]